MTPTLRLKKTYYTPQEIADIAGVSRQTVVKWIECGRLDASMTPGGHWRINPDAVDGGASYEIRAAKA